MPERMRGLVYHKARVYTGGEKECPVCANKALQFLMDSVSTPIHPGLLWHKKEDALSVPMGDMQLAFCPNCGHTFNALFNSDLLNYNTWFENSLHSCSRFQSPNRPEADRLIERYGINDKEIFEIHHGASELSMLLCELANNQAVIYQPDMYETPGRSNSTQQVTYIIKPLSGENPHIHADLICCQNIIERLSHPRMFIELLRGSISYVNETVGYFEVFNAEISLKNQRLWDMNYAQCSFYSPFSLRFLFENSGFRILSLRELAEGKILALDVSLALQQNPIETIHQQNDLEGITRSVEKFKEKTEHSRIYWSDLFREYATSAKRVVLWGCNERGVIAINALKIQDRIQMVVDGDFTKVDLFVPGTGHRVHSLGQLPLFKPDVILISQPGRENEIRQIIGGMNIEPEILTL